MRLDDNSEWDGYGCTAWLFVLALFIGGGYWLHSHYEIRERAEVSAQP